MTKKLAAFIVLTFLLVPFASLAQSPTGSQSRNLQVADIADESIVVLSTTDQGGMAGYVHQQYAFLCFGQWEIVDHYGAPIDPKDQNILRTERRLCSQRTLGDDGSDD